MTIHATLSKLYDDWIRPAILRPTVRGTLLWWAFLLAMFCFGVWL